jgi:hypothetical protein
LAESVSVSSSLFFYWPFAATDNNKTAHSSIACHDAKIQQAWMGQLAKQFCSGLHMGEASTTT